MHKGQGYKFEADYEYDKWDFNPNFSADQYFLKWKCPKCGHCHPEVQYDLYEYFDEFSDFAELEIQCEECEQEFAIQIEGETHWEGHTFKLKTLEPQ